MTNADGPSAFNKSMADLAPNGADGQPPAAASHSPNANTSKPPSPNFHGSATHQADIPAPTAADADSEAETLIQSPEKKKPRLVESTPKLQPTTANGRENGGDHESATAKSPSSEHHGRKRKRSDDEINDRAHRLSPRKTPPLPSPMPHARPVDQVSPRSLSRKPSNELPLDIARENISVKKSESEEKGLDGAGSRSPVQQQRSKSEFEDNQSRTFRKRDSPDIANAGRRRGIRSATYPRNESPSRSRSPRSGEGQKRIAPVQSIQTLASHKTRRIPAPLNTRRNESSDRSSETSNSPAPTRPYTIKLIPFDNEATSPAKVMAKKLRDRHGRTWLAQACTDDKLDRVRQMYEERPQDLNVADNAGNTPVQIAALQGYVAIVEFLLEKNCDVNTRNIEKDTPLIDAVENGHVEVVKLLLEHEADPRLGNATGQKPLELVDEDDAAIRKLLIDAKDKSLRRRRSEDHAPSIIRRESSSRAASAASPRDSSPVFGPKSPPVIQLSRRRAREQTRNDLLWQANTPGNLTKLASKGDTEGVVNILNILNRASPEALIAACKGGHDEVLQLLIAMGNPDPDPEPVVSQDQRRGYDTPMLAAIGEGNIQSIKLLLAQDGFNPTREIRGRTYFEISEERKGDNWAEERKALKAAYHGYQQRHSKHSTPRKAREAERRRAKGSSSPFSKRDRSLPRSQNDVHPHKIAKSTDTKVTSRRNASDDHSAVVSSDHDHGHVQRQSHKVRRSRSDALNVQSEEEVRKRRRLVSRKEHMKSYSDVDGESSGQEQAVDVKCEKPLTASIPRRRTSVAAQATPALDTASLKKRSRRALSDSSPEDVRNMKRKMSNQEYHVGPVSEAKILRDVNQVFQKQRQSTALVKDSSALDKGGRNPRTHPETGKDRDQIEKKQEAERLERVRLDREAAQASAAREKEESEKAAREAQQKAAAAAAAEEQRLLVERQRAEEAAAAAQRKAEEVAAAKKKAEEVAVAKKKAEEVAVAKRKAEEEAAAAAAVVAAAAAAKKKADEEALARKKEEEEAERQERMRREVEEKQRRAEERRQRILRESEQRRMEALPRLLCQSAKLLDQNSAEAKSPDFLSKFLPLFTVKTEQIDGYCSSEVANDEWLPGFQAAPLLAAKNLGLEHLTHWEKRKVSDQERPFLWKVARTMLIQGGGGDESPHHPHQHHHVHLGVGVGGNPFDMSIDQALQLDRETQPKFQAMQPLVWVKLSDFRERLPLHPYLQPLPIRTQRIGLRMPKPNPPSAPHPPPHSKPNTNSHHPTFSPISIPSPASQTQSGVAVAPTPSPPSNNCPSHVSENVPGQGRGQGQGQSQSQSQGQGPSLIVNGVHPDGVGAVSVGGREGRENRAEARVESRGRIVGGVGARGVNGFHNDPPPPRSPQPPQPPAPPGSGSGSVSISTPHVDQ